MSYYKDELSKVNAKDYPATIKVSGHGETKWMSLNEESAKEVVEWIKQNYLKKSKKKLQVK